MKGRVKKLKPLVETRFLNVYEATYINKFLKEKHWMIASRKDYQTLSKKYFENKKDEVDAVVIIPFHKESKKIAIVKQFRVPLNDYVYELPAGLIEKSEDVEVTIKRELKEETGLNLLSINKNLGKEQLYLSPGMTEESVNLAYCICDGEITNKYLEEDEDIEAILIDQNEAKQLLKENVKMDIKLFMILQNFALFGEKIFEN